MVEPNITLISGPRLDILGFSMRFPKRRRTICHRGRHVIWCIVLKDGLYYCNLKDFLQVQKGTECSDNLVQPYSIELAGTPLPTVIERLY